jgi:DNA polymerase-3 subunit beta
MKTKILQEKLNSMISQVEKITGKDATLPVLGNILLKAGKNSLTAISTNLETGISWESIAKTEEEGEVILPAQMFSGLINSLAGGMVEIETNGNLVLITNDRRKSNLGGLTSDEFPVLPVNTEGEFLTVRADLFCQALVQVVNFTSNSSVKPEITGIYLNFLKNQIKIVATDSFRLGEKIFAVSGPGNIQKDRAIIIPLRAAREIISIFSDKQKNINIYFSQNQITVELDDDGDNRLKIKFISRLIEGEFPDYQAIIPTSSSATAVFSKKEMLEQLKPAGLFSGKNSEVAVKTNRDNSLIAVSSQSSELGGYNGELKAEISGKDAAVVFNLRFLIDGLNSIKTDKCVFEFSGDEGPGLLKPAEGQDFIYILMPIKKY